MAQAHDIIDQILAEKQMTDSNGKIGSFVACRCNNICFFIVFTFSSPLHFVNESAWMGRIGNSIRFQAIHLNNKYKHKMFTNYSIREGRLIICYISHNETNTFCSHSRNIEISSSNLISKQRKNDSTK